MVKRRAIAFKDARLRLRWAKESLSSFERSARLYFKRTPYSRIVDPDPDGIHERHKLKLHKPFPDSLTKNTIRTVENLRSALDLMAVYIADLLHLPVKDISFPFCKTAIDFENRIASCCNGFPKEITGLWKGYEPYGRENNLLFAINELCNTSKHRIIVPVGSKAGLNFPHIETFGGALPIRIFQGFWEWDKENNEITYAITERGLKWKHHVQIALGVFFGDVGDATGREVKPNLTKMIEVVELIINETEMRCRKLRLL